MSRAPTAPSTTTASVTSSSRSCSALERGITPGPIATFLGWLEKGRCVRRGEKAIVLCMPITVKRKAEEQPLISNDRKPDTFTRFVFRPHWFVLAQTDGRDVEPLPIPDWDRRRALETLGIVEEPFAMHGRQLPGLCTAAHDRRVAAGGTAREDAVP